MNMIVDTTPNKWYGGNRCEAIIIHWWNDPSKKPTLNGVVSWFKNPTSQVSAHYVVSGDTVVKMMEETDKAWHAMHANDFSIGIEIDPNTPGNTYQTVNQLVKDIRSRRGNIPLKRHSDYVNTNCPGTIDLKRIEESDMIPDADNYFGRYNKAMHFIRGRTMSRTEFRKNFVGNTDLRMLEAMLDDPEAERFTLDGELGRVARQDNWEGQIHALNAKVKELSTRPTTDQLKELKKQIESLTKSAESAAADRDKLKDQMTKDEEAGRSFFRQVADWLRTLGIK